MLSVDRQEMKFLLTKRSSLSLQSELSRLMRPDPFSAAGYYQVRSLYFDSLYDIDHQDKLAGVKVRKKVRLRIYGADDPVVKLELKAKDGGYQRKQSLQVDREEAKALIGGAYHILLERKEETAKRLYAILTKGAYRPAAIIEYSRRAFQYPDFCTRLTFDEDVKACRSTFDLFRKDLPLVPVFDEAVVLEVKFDGMLIAPIRRILAKYQLCHVSVGKYEIARGGCV